MIINNIDLYNFRNYPKCHLELLDTKNIIIGNNGTGKTNILESIILVANTKSFRATNDKEMILKNAESARVDVTSGINRYRVILNDSGKSLFINQTNIKKSSDFIGKINAVLFKPDDLEIFTRGPKYRRKLIDLELGKISKDYLNAILLYTKLVKDKNSLLKEENIDNVYLKVINERLVEPIYKIIKYRQEFIDYINTKIEDYYTKLSGHKEKISIDYHRCCEIDKDKVEEMINNSLKKDLFYHYSLVGPHKEDITFLFHDSDVVNYASQGQKRLLVLSFKLALVDYIIYKTNEKPILLLDDIFSELDLDNRQRLLHTLPNNIQTIITTTDIKDINLKDEYRLFKLEKRRNIND